MGSFFDHLGGSGGEFLRSGNPQLPPGAGGSTGESFEGRWGGGWGPLTAVSDSDPLALQKVIVN